MGGLLRETLKQLGDTFVRVTESLLQTENLFSDDREAEVPGLDGSCMNRAYGDFVDAIALDGDEGIGFGDGWKWMASIDVAAQREYALRPAAVAQPTACIEFVGRESEEVVDRPLHAEGSGERCGDARIRGRRYVCDAVFDYEHGVWQKIRCVDAKAKVAVTFIRPPEREEAGARFLQFLGHLRPLLAIDVQTGARYVGGQRDLLLACRVRRHLHPPISKAAARYHSART